VEDAVHDVFRGGSPPLWHVRPRAPDAPWLLGIAFRIAAQWRQPAPPRGHRRGDPSPSTPADTRLPDEVVASRQASRRLQAALAELDIDQRAVVVMHDLNGIPVPEIATRARSAAQHRLLAAPARPGEDHRPRSEVSLERVAPGDLPEEWAELGPRRCRRARPPLRMPRSACSGGWRSPSDSAWGSSPRRRAARLPLRPASAARELPGPRGAAGGGTGSRRDWHRRVPAGEEDPGDGGRRGGRRGRRDRGRTSRFRSERARSTARVVMTPRRRRSPRLGGATSAGATSDRGALGHAGTGARPARSRTAGHRTRPSSPRRERCSSGTPRSFPRASWPRSERRWSSVLLLREGREGEARSRAQRFRKLSPPEHPAPWHRRRPPGHR
jgi:hypothetical protein